MDGFININKPQNITSFDVIRRLKPLFPRRHKLGHLGTLDPMAVGVLPVAAGQASKMIPYIGPETKAYTAVMTLGAVSDTQDAEGNLTYTGRVDFEESRLRASIAELIGDIEQIPPMFSALHHEGKRLYELARQGIEIERKPRAVTINALEIININRERKYPELTLQVECSGGAYIRSLCHDIGQLLGTGAYMSALLRTRSGIFSLPAASSLEELSDASRIAEQMLPIDYPLQHLPEIIIYNQSDCQLIKNGQYCIVKDCFSQPVRMYTAERILCGIGRTEQVDGKVYLRPVRLLTEF